MIKQYLQLIRVPQWIKNSFVFVPLLFSRHFFEGNYFLTVVGGFFVFCIISSAVYIINDIIDIEADRAHPKKRFRPLASGKISKRSAVIVLSVMLVITAVLLPNFDLSFIIVVISYFILNLAYSLKLKHIVLLDIFSIAAGFMLRVIGGGVIIHVEISSWLILTTMFISLFLAVMKRHSELNLMHNGGEAVTRKVLSQYSISFANQMSTITAAGVIVCYALYTVSQRTVSVFGTDNLIYTTPFVVYGIFRYMYLVYMNKKGENTTEIMITDVSMIVNIFLYLLATTLIIYRVIK